MYLGISRARMKAMVELALLCHIYTETSPFVGTTKNIWKESWPESWPSELTEWAQNASLSMAVGLS